jgi:hypothetical protein
MGDDISILFFLNKRVLAVETRVCFAARSVPVLYLFYIFYG